MVHLNHCFSYIYTMQTFASKPIKQKKQEERMLGNILSPFLYILSCLLLRHNGKHARNVVEIDAVISCGHINISTTGKTLS